MSELIPDSTFLSSNNNDTDDIYGNAWMSLRLALEGEFDIEDYGSSPYGRIKAIYSVGLSINTIESFWNYIDGADEANCLQIFEEDKMFVYTKGHPDIGYTFYTIESNLDYPIALDSSKIYNLSYQVIGSHFNSSFSLNQYYVEIELFPLNSNMDTISFIHIATNFNVSYNVENTVYNPPSGNYQVRFKFTITSSWVNGPNSACRQKFEIDNVSLVEDTTDVAVPVISDIEGNTNEVIPFNHKTYASSEEPSDNLQTLSIEYNDGWNLFGVSLKIDTIIVGHNGHPDKSYNDLGADSGNYNLVDFIKNHLYANETDALPIFYNGSDGPDNFAATVVIGKNNGGFAWLPEYDFNGIGNLPQFEGLQIKFNESATSLYNKVYLRYTGEIVTDISYTYYSNTGQQANNTLLQGWNMLSFPGIEPVDVTEYFAEFYNAGIMVIVKDYLGNVWLPQYDFNGIGNMLPGQGYQLKIS